MKLIRIESLNHLKKVLSKGSAEFFIALKYGCKSSKTISYDKDEDVFKIDNWIDGTTQKLSSKELMSKQFTNVGRAIKKGAFYFECSGRQQ